MTAAQAVDQAKKGKLLPVYLVAGEERLFREEVVGELRAGSLAGGVAAFNEDKFTAGEVEVDTVIAAARTVPMMARLRFVLVRGAERWDSSAPAATSRGESPEPTESDGSAFERLAQDAAAPAPSTC